jgi:hypothetical protein
MENKTKKASQGGTCTDENRNKKGKEQNIAP